MFHKDYTNLVNLDIRDCVSIKRIDYGIFLPNCNENSSQSFYDLVDGG